MAEMKQWDIRVPPTTNLGSHRYGPVRRTMAEAKRAALEDYNGSRQREGLPPLRSLPRGTKTTLYQSNPKRSFPRGKWIKTRIMVTRSGQIKVKL